VDLIHGARAFPIRECLVNESWRGRGLAHILLARTQPDGKVLFGLYLVDTFCLGLKNTFCNAGFSLAVYEHGFRLRMLSHEPMAPCPVPLAHEIIYGAIDYAAGLGFRPHPDFKLSEHILEPREALREKTGVEFGKDGKPFFISGPDDDVGLILRKLRERVGDGNFHFMIGGPV
jgi:hypothetical protein